MEEQIKASLREKEVLLKEVHHRVNNNMQVIYGLFEIQSDYIRDEKCLDIFRSCKNQIISMALVHKILYRSKNLAKIDFHDYISNLTRKLFQSYGVNTDKINLKINIGEISLSVDTSIRCGLIVNELVSNSLKYAFPEEKEGEVKIELHSINENEFELTVSDNGIGMPKKIDIQKTETLGLKMVDIFVEDMLRGKIKLNRAAGTEYRIRFKV